MGNNLQDPYFLLYSFFLAFLAFLVFYTSKDLLVYQLVLVVSFILAAGFRDFSVPDTPEYIYLFKSYNDSLLDSQYIGQEFGFIFLGKLIKLSFDSTIVYFLVISTINMLLIRSALKNLNCNVSLGLIAYISYYGLLLNFIFLRVGLAISILVYVFSLIVTNKKVKAIFFLFIAPLFHKSIVLLIAILPILKLDLKRNAALFILFFSLSLYLTGASDFLLFKFFEVVKSITFFSKYIYYIENAKFESGYSFRYLMNVFIMFIVVKYTVNYDEIKGVLKIFLFGLFLTALLSVFLWVDRITDAFIVFNFIIVTMFVCEKNKFGSFKSFNICVYFVFIVTNLFFASRVLTKFIFDQII